MLYRLLSVFIRREVVVVRIVTALDEGEPSETSPCRDDPLAGLCSDLERELIAAGYLR
ncbi:hypothetical protein [Methylobacterium brachythecii]|uniref:Uncharacterized protein n=1 Tax=Methylobacterium brachythecii TaxID=1176177 RepID=A0A7W6AGM4_9HYPH|nr:hypothetical protein [Methylobacterium brachythecii]MBB3900869.1 hypothetical protein [Methylobacterium brachythecii]GLS46434.1 hypothetical protein GCM10007884_44280 [Methylobacterium brachythecii]